jgi:hypothetical protein
VFKKFCAERPWKRFITQDAHQLSTLPSQLQCSNRLVPGHGWKIIDELVERISRLKIVEQILDRNSRAEENGNTSLDITV